MRAAICAFLLLVPGWQPALAAKASCVLLLEHNEPSAYTDLLKAGLERAGRELDLATKVVVASEDQDQEGAFLKAASENDFVIVASDNMHELLRDNAANFRRVKFGVIDAGIRAPNLSCITFADEEAAYLAGTAAARLAKSMGSSVIGWLSGMDTPAMRSLFSGYAQGAEMAVPDIRVIQAIAGSFADPAVAEEKAGQLAAKGASVIALAAGAGNTGAAKALARTGAFVISLDSWQPDILPGKTMAGITKAVDRAVYQLCEDFTKNGFKGKEIVIYNIANDGVALKGFDEFAKTKYPDIARRVNELAREFKNGNIKLRSLRERTLCDCLD